jgi:hypothetical protein
MALAQGNPFVGLRPYDAGDSLLFFGRQQQAAELLQRLHNVRFVAVVGSSGCGKSSLVRAGLIPKLEAGFLLDDRDVWHIGRMKPGDAPIDNLAAALLEAYAGHDKPQPHAFASEIREQGVQAVFDRASTLVRTGDCNLLLLVDQFEEIFRFDLYGNASDDAGAAEFVALLLELTAQEEIPVYVVMTMRSDFMGDCDRFLGLPEAMNRSQYLVPRLSRQQRREAIEGPARLFGAEITPRLIDRLLNESIDTRDDLPVLQHALMRTWDEWASNGGGPIDFSHYEAIGTMHTALSRDAEAALKGMNERQRLITKRLFQSLTTIDSGNRGIRRPAKLREITERNASTAEETWDVIQRFRDNSRSFLVVSSEQIEDDPLVDISHESLIRQWKTLGGWVEEESESIRTYRRLADTAALYQQRRAGFYRDPDLQVALDWREQEAPTERWAQRHHPAFADAMRFLDDSRALREREYTEEAFKRQWRVPSLIVLGIVLALFFELGPGAWTEFWKTRSTQAGDFVLWFADSARLQNDREYKSAVDTYAKATGEMLKVGGHLLLFLALAGVVRFGYRRYLFRAAPADPTRHSHHQDSFMAKARRTIELVARWASVLLGCLIVGSCAMIGSSTGSSMWLILIGIVIALALVGWVLAAIRLNADIKDIRKDIARIDVAHASLTDADTGDHKAGRILPLA